MEAGVTLTATEGSILKGTVTIEGDGVFGAVFMSSTLSANIAFKVSSTCDSDIVSSICTTKEVAELSFRLCMLKPFLVGYIKRCIAAKLFVVGGTRVQQDPHTV